MPLCTLKSAPRQLGLFVEVLQVSCVRVQHEAKSDERTRSRDGAAYDAAPPPNMPRISQSAKTSALGGSVVRRLEQKNMVAGVTGSPSTDRIALGPVAPSGDVGFTACTVDPPVPAASTNETPLRGMLTP